MFQHLDWDSAFFGFKTAMLSSDHYLSAELCRNLQKLKEQNYRLAYLFGDPNDKETNKTAMRQGGILVDEKVTFLIKLKETGEYSNESEIKVYPVISPGPDLIKLAIESGEYSRFKMDKRIPEGKFEELYTQWITNSTLRQNAEEVYVYKAGGAIKGMITANRKGITGNIGLIAVDTAFKGLGIGKTLVSRVLKYCRDNHLENLTVVTQMANKSACRFYESLGFKIMGIKNVYHFWIE